MVDSGYNRATSTSFLWSTSSNLLLVPWQELEAPDNKDHGHVLYCYFLSTKPAIHLLAAQVWLVVGGSRHSVDSRVEIFALKEGLVRGIGGLVGACCGACSRGN